MISLFVVLLHPGGDRAPGISQIDKPVHIQAFLSDSSVEAFHEAVLVDARHRLTGIDEVEFGSLAVSPLVELITDELRIVIQHDRFRVAAAADSNLLEHANDVEQFLSERPNVHLHFTPTYSSWLNQVEIWFSKIERDLIARGIFTSVSDLKRKLMRYIREHNKAPKPIKGNYADPTRRITGVSSVTVH